MPDLDREEILALLEFHRRTIESSTAKMEDLVRDARTIEPPVPYRLLEEATGLSRGWLDEIVHGRRKQDSSG